MAATKLSNLIDPQVIADFVNVKLIDAIRFAPLCIVKNDLVGKDGDTLSLPKWAYIGDATQIAEGGAIPVENLSNSKVDVKVHKLAKGVGFTDEADLEGLGDLTSQAVDQIVKSIASAVEVELLEQMNGAKLTYSYDSSAKGAVNVAKALENFGEDMDGAKVLLIAPETYSTIIGEIVPNTDAGATILKSGNVGQIMGCQVVVSNRLSKGNVTYALTSDVAVVSGKTYYTRTGTEGAYVYTKVAEPTTSDIGTYYEKSESAEAFIVKPQALALIGKRDTMVEFDRDPQTQTDYIFGSKLYAPYLYDDSKIVKITF